MLTAVIWGAACAGQRAGMETIEPVTFNAARMILAAAAIGALTLFIDRKDRRSLSARTSEELKNCKKATAIGGICCGTCLAAATISQQMGMVYTDAGKAGFITSMYIIFVPVINSLVFKKRSDFMVWAAVFISAAGMFLLCAADGFSLTRGDTLIVVCALFFSCHILCCDHFARLGSPIRISAIQFITAALISAVIAPIAEEPNWHKISSAALPILYCGIVSGGIGYTLQMAAQKFTNPTAASLIMSLEAVFAVIAGTLLLNEHMSPKELLGCAVMFAAVIMVQFTGSNAPKEQTSRQ